MRTVPAGFKVREEDAPQAAAERKLTNEGGRLIVGEVAVEVVGSLVRSCIAGSVGRGVDPQE